MHYRRLKAALVKGEVTLGLAQQLTPLIRAGERGAARAVWIASPRSQ
jgi:hypothetical protein